MCPVCRRYFCRECVTEHDGRMTCTACVAALHAPAQGKRSSRFLLALGAGGGFLLAWFLFYYAGVWLARIPDTFYGAAR